MQESSKHCTWDEEGLGGFQGHFPAQEVELYCTSVEQRVECFEICELRLEKFKDMCIILHVKCFGNSNLGSKGKTEERNDTCNGSGNSWKVVTETVKGKCDDKSDQYSVHSVTRQNTQDVDGKDTTSLGE